MKQIYYINLIYINVNKQLLKTGNFFDCFIKKIKKIFNYIYNLKICRVGEIEKLVGVKNKLKNLPITIDHKLEINESNLIKTYKEFFCPICCIYDC